MEWVLLKDALQLQCIAQVNENNAVDHARLVKEKETNKGMSKRGVRRAKQQCDKEDSNTLNNGHCEVDILVFEALWM